MKAVISKPYNINGTESDAIDMTRNVLVGIDCPSGIASTTLTLKNSTTETGTFVAVSDIDGNAISITVAASKYVVLDPSTFAGLMWVKLVAGSTETDKEFSVSLRPIV